MSATAHSSSNADDLLTSGVPAGAESEAGLRDTAGGSRGYEPLQGELNDVLGGATMPGYQNTWLSRLIWYWKVVRLNRSTGINRSDWTWSPLCVVSYFNTRVCFLTPLLLSVKEDLKRFLYLQCLFCPTDQGIRSASDGNFAHSWDLEGGECWLQALHTSQENKQPTSLCVQTTASMTSLTTTPSWPRSSQATPNIGRWVYPMHCTVVALKRLRPCTLDIITAYLRLVKFMVLDQYLDTKGFQLAALEDYDLTTCLLQ